MDTSSVRLPAAPVLRLEEALSSVPLEERENYSMGSTGHDLRQPLGGEWDINLSIWLMEVQCELYVSIRQQVIGHGSKKA